MFRKLKILNLSLVVVSCITCSLQAYSQLFTFSEKRISKGVSRHDDNIEGYLRYKKVYYNVWSRDDFLPLIYLDWKENKKYFHDCIFSYPGKLLVDSCTFFEDTAIFNRMDYGDNCPEVYFIMENLQIARSILKRDLAVRNVVFKRDLIIDSVYDEDDWGNLSLFQDSLSYFFFNNISNCHLLIDSCFFEKNTISFEDSKSISAELSNSTTQDSTLEVWSSNSKGSYKILKNSAIKLFTISSNNDSLFQLQSSIQNNFLSNFTHSFITGIIDVDSAKTNILKFHYCKFSNAAIIVDNIDTLEFEDCTIQNSLQLWSNNGNRRKIAMRFKSTDIEKINFEYQKEMILFFRDESFDEINSLYQSLLSKFQREGKSVSYKNVDIEYRRLMLYRKGLLGRFWSLLSEWWWNYGYDRNKILFHTFTFLSLFFIINLLMGKRLLEFYPILLFDKHVEKKPKTKLVIKYIIRVFILTTFIFFSLKIDFQKINANKTKMMLYFFLQYFIGLICLFFLFNAILKI